MTDFNLSLSKDNLNLVLDTLIYRKQTLLSIRETAAENELGVIDDYVKTLEAGIKTITEQYLIQIKFIKMGIL